MEQQLLSSFGKRGVKLGLNTLRADIEDTTYLSKYFVVSEFNPILTAGKNSISFNGSILLSTGSEIKAECLDSAGNSLYLEYPQSNVQYTDVSKFVISISVFAETYNGPGKFILVGTTTKGEVVRWTANITIDKTLQNSSKVRFYNKPSMEVRGLLYPVIANNAISQLTSIIPFTGSFYSYPVSPPKDTNQYKIDLKKSEIDYRIALQPPVNSSIPTLCPTTSFNSQMEGQAITLIAKNIQVPFSYINEPVNNLTASAKIEKVLNDNTLQLSDMFFYTIGKDQYVTSINSGVFTSFYTWVAYNTQSDAYLKYTPEAGNTIYIKQSYAEILYRNIAPFSGFIARHKIYRKSLAYPGDFQLIVDEPLNATELLIDPITANQTYPKIGSFYNQFHINKYWFTSSNYLQISHSTNPFIDAIHINKASTYDNIDGTSYVIAKADSENVNNDAIYYPYVSASFLSMSGSSYNSNFINLKSNTLYVLSMNVQLNKDIEETDSKISFYFTSSIPEIKHEKNYESKYGLKLGEISTGDLTAIKRFSGKQYLFFTPNADYYGTLVIVPNKCGAIISDLSMKVYGDYGFSPDTMDAKIPFKLNVKNETFQFKSELFDINSTLVYSDLNTIQTFDPNGESLFVYIENSNLDPSTVSFISGSLTISKSLFLPNINGCPSDGIRLVGWHSPQSYPPSNVDGEICYTDISNLSLAEQNNYINLTTTNGLTNNIGRSISVRFTGSNPSGAGGRRIFIDSSGIKYQEP